MTSFDHAEIDDVIHGLVRLGTLAYLSAAKTVEFRELQRRLRVTEGNLSVHLKKLETAGYIAVEKQGAGRASVTRILLTTAGGKAFARYVDSMDKLVHEVRSAEQVGQTSRADPARRQRATST
jgi:DNA-binding MarR family transcriptional regulator